MGITRDDLPMTWAAWSTQLRAPVRGVGAWPIFFLEKTDASGVRPRTAPSSIGQGLPALKDGRQAGSVSGKWQIMITASRTSGSSAQAAKKALGQENIQERIFIVHLINDKNDKNRIGRCRPASRCATTRSSSTGKAILSPAGGCVNLFRPRSVGEGTGPRLVPVWNAGVRPTRWPPRPAPS